MKALSATVSYCTLTALISGGAAQAANFLVSTEAEFLSAISDINAGADPSGRIVLADDVVIRQGTIVPTASKDVYIDTTGGHTLTLDGEASFDRIVEVEGNGSLTVNGRLVSTARREGVRGGSVTYSGGAAHEMGTFSRFGFLDGADASLTITGAGTSVTTGRFAYYATGEHSTTSVRVMDGAQLTGASRTHVSTETVHEGGTASIQVTGSGSLFSVGQLESGYRGSASYAVFDGGRIESRAVNMGGNVVNAGRGDHVLISGLNSSWQASGHFQFHEGSLTVLDGGSLTADALSIAHTNRNVDARISSGSALSTVSGNIDVGATGVGALTVGEGATISSIAGAGDILLATTGSGTGILNIGGDGQSPATSAGIVDAAQIIFGDGDGVLNFNHTDIALNFDPDLVGMGTVNQMGSGHTRLDEDNAMFTGVTNVEAGTLTVNGTLGGVIRVNAGRLQGAGIVGSTLHAVDGVIAPGNSIGTLTIAGDYVGADGILEIEAELGEDSSPSDLLVINGDSSGSARVQVTNVGGAGALTSNGIKVIDVAGTSAGHFALMGDYVAPDGEQAVVAGAYAYTLNKNGITDPTDGDWYLRSQMVPADAPDPAPAEASGTPRFQAGVPLYEQYPALLHAMSRMPTLQQRVGNRYWRNDELNISQSMVTEANGRGVWGRVDGSIGRLSPIFSSSASTREVDTLKLQVGVNLPLFEASDGSELVGGITAHHGNGSADIHSPSVGSGRIEATSYGLGSTLTWYGTSGLYVDGQAELTWFDSDLHSSTVGLDLVNGNDGSSFGLSVEAGQRFAFDDAWTATPQAQLTFTRVDFDPFADIFNASISNAGNASLLGRLGVAVERSGEWKAEKNTMSRSHVYGIVNLLNEFQHGGEVSVSGVSFRTQDERLWGSLGLGGSYNWNNDQYSLYGEAEIASSLQNVGESYRLNATAGFRMSW